MTTTPLDDSNCVERMVVDIEAVIDLSEASLSKYFDQLLNKKEKNLPTWLRASANVDLTQAAFKSLMKSLALLPKEKMKTSLSKEDLFPSVFKKTTVVDATTSATTAESEQDEVIRKARKRHRSDKRSGHSSDKRSKVKATR